MKLGIPSMAVIQTKISDLINKSSIPFIDVRSPGEFQKGHIPGAINLPLFSDLERAMVGTIYKQTGKQAAILKGLEFVGPRIKFLLEQAIDFSYQNNLILYCWRGGMRSASLAWLFSQAGLEISIVEGGYKAYRRLARTFYEESNIKFLVLSGRTGTGKTDLLNRLHILGEQIIDLESIANHKGSAFGWIGQSVQRSNEQFENDLFQAIYGLDFNKVIWIENESRTIGRNFIPEELWNKIKSAPIINIERTIESRLEQLLFYYEIKNDNALKVSFEKIRKRLGHEWTQKAIEFIELQNYHEAAKIALRYYDTCYDYNLVESSSPQIFNIDFSDKSIQDITIDLLKFKQLHFGKGN
ncbi:MAG: tRNA 2-selenouridine(34) synthase MnmH [Saprospiraceae bacterium]|nr:tRNA 2-selenouridine(34) synthase MnmH [Saprospiraceae bacterium]